MEAMESFLDRYMMLEFNFKGLIDMFSKQSIEGITPDRECCLCSVQIQKQKGEMDAHIHPFSLCLSLTHFNTHTHTPTHTDLHFFKY